MKRTYGALAYALIAPGIVHMAATPMPFAALNGSAFWFFNGGIVLLLTGAINLLNRAYGAIAPGVR